MAKPVPTPKIASSISISCPVNQPASAYTTTGLWMSGTYATDQSGVKIQCWCEYPAGTIVKSLMTAPTSSTTWRVQFTTHLPNTQGNYADLTAHLFDSTGTTELAASSAVEVKLTSVGGANDC
jgi:hypothetical protein